MERGEVLAFTWCWELGKSDVMFWNLGNESDFLLPDRLDCRYSSFSTRNIAAANQHPNESEEEMEGEDLDEEKEFESSGDSLSVVSTKLPSCFYGWLFGLDVQFVSTCEKRIKFDEVYGNFKSQGLDCMCNCIALLVNGLFMEYSVIMFVHDPAGVCSTGVSKRGVRSKEETPQLNMKLQQLRFASDKLLGLSDHDESPVATEETNKCRKDQEQASCQQRCPGCKLA